MKHGTPNKKVKQSCPSPIVWSVMVFKNSTISPTRDIIQRSSSLNGMDLAKCRIAVLLGFPAMSINGRQSVGNPSFTQTIFCENQPGQQFISTYSGFSCILWSYINMRTIHQNIFPEVIYELCTCWSIN